MDTLQTIRAMKTTKRNLLSILSAVLATLAHAAPPQVTNISYSQRANTKQVDIRYDLAIDAGEKAYVEFFFSHDNGATFPVICQAMTGDAGPGISPGGGKMAVWDAGVDWNKQFTEDGRIRIKATYGDKPTGSGSFHTVEIPFVAGSVLQSPSSLISKDYQAAPLHTGISGPPKKYFVDDREVTNAKWDEVVEFSKTKGYDLEKVPAGSIPDMPRTNVSFLDAVKWCNARSEMEGFTPVYYLDAEEAMGDFNADGVYANGPDSLYPPQSVYEQDPNFQWDDAAMDPNKNYRWDPGEPFYDKNGNGKFEPTEFVDFNQNGKRDSGWTIPYRVGDLTAYVTKNAHWWDMTSPDPDNSWGQWSLMFHEKLDANGYQLPHQGDYTYTGHMSEFLYLAMGGRPENGVQTEIGYDQASGTPIMGIRYQEEWPWGTENPATSASRQEQVVTSIGGQTHSGPLPVGTRKPNGYGLYDMIGNVAEWRSDLTIGNYIQDPSPLTKDGLPVGGSYRGLSDGTNTMWGTSPHRLGMQLTITPSSVMVAGEFADLNGESWVGFRSMRVEF